MTEDYKKTLLDYTTGTIESGQPSQEIKIESETPLKRTYRQQIAQLLDVGSISYGELVATKNAQNEYTKETIVWGSYYPKNAYDMSDLRSFIALVDKNMNLIKLFEDYDNIQNKAIQNLAVDENGNIYGVDGIPQSDGSLKNTRFIMLNNPTVQDASGNYNLRLRYSVYLPNDSGMTTIRRASQLHLNKAIGSSSYLIGDLITNNGNFVGYYFTELKINVGSANEWNYYRTTDNYANSVLDINSYWDSDRVYIKFLTQVITVSPNNFDIYEFTLNGNGTFDKVRIYREAYTTYTPDSVAKYFNYNEFIFTINNSTNIIVNKYKNNAYNIIYTKTKNQNYVYQFKIRRLEDVIYIVELADENYVNKTLELLLIDLTNIYTINILPEELTYTDGSIIVDRKEFNLITIDYDYYLENQPYDTMRLKLIFNQNQYNGETYINEDSLCPLYSNLYSNGSLEFSRDLYNISKQNNMTMASVEIPNSYLNDTTITQNDLISETNLQMNSNNQQWTKNIYEVVDINFLNTIRVIDEDTGTEYLESAIKLNEATTDGGATNYLNTPCNKYRINYLDGTTSTDNLYWNTIDDTHKETQITLFVDAPMLSIDFISNDETTIYLNIPLEVEENKTYTISQKIRIGE